MSKSRRRRGARATTSRDIKIDLSRLDTFVMDERTGRLAHPTLISVIEDGVIVALKLVFPTDFDGRRSDG